MNATLLTFLFAASNIYADPLGHAGGTPIAGTTTTATSATAVSADVRPQTTAEGTLATGWDVRTTAWTILGDWQIANPSGLLLILK